MSIEKLIEKWRSERAHTYSSENADHYRGFGAGRQRSADDLEAELPAIRELVEAAKEAEISLEALSGDRYCLRLRAAIKKVEE